MAENLTPKKYIDNSNMKQILTAVKNEIHSDDSQTLTESQYLALPEEERLNNSYYLYDVGVHYKNGVAYSRKKPIQLTMEEYKALGEVDPDQEYIVSTDEQGILLEASDIGYSNAVSNLPCTTVQGAIDKVNAKLGEKVDYKVVVEDSTRYVEDIVVQDINTWLPNNNSSIVVNLKKANGANYSNFQLLCNKQDSKNWTCIVIGGISTFWRICYVNEVRYIEEIATMDKVVPQVIIENKTTDDARTIIQNSWGAFPTNNSLAKIETSIFTWSAQIYKLDSSWGTIILTCYADNKDSYIGKLSNKAWHWYKMGLTEV